MPKIAPIVEGDGEVSAVPLLLRRLLYEELQAYDWTILRPKNAHGSGGLTTENGIERFIRYALLEPECDAVLVLVDSDASQGLPETEKPKDDCAPAFAKILARRISALNPPIPVVVIVARWEYEAWLLASLETLEIPTTSPYEGNVEEVRSPKGWIEARLPAGQKYRETIDQVALTSKLDIKLVEQRSRSFRRLKNALSQILEATQQKRSIITPL
jgi:hypothetical protein